MAYQNLTGRVWELQTFCTQDLSFPERKVSMENFRSPGTKIPGTFVPGTFRSRELSFLENESYFRSWDLSYPGTFVPIIR